MEQNEKDADSDGEMGSAVIRVQGLQEPFIWKKQLLDSFFVIEPDSTFEADDLHGIIERIQRDIITTDANRPEAVAGERIDEIKRPHDEDFFPPPRAVLTDLVWHRGGGVIGHDVSTVGRAGLGLMPSVGLGR